MAVARHSWIRCSLGLLLAATVLAAGQVPEAPPPSPPSAPVNRVLDLNGRGAHAVLPTAPFEGLTNATVEAWVRWESLGGTRRVFNYGAPLRDVSLLSRDGSRLAWVVADPRESPRWLIIADVLRRRTWHHVAAVSGAEGMRLYLNGVPLLPIQIHTGSFATAAAGGRCYLGRSVTDTDREERFHGQIDEVRVWDHARTPEQIRAGMFQRPPAATPGLVFQAGFDADDPAVELREGARRIEFALPASTADLEAPTAMGPQPRSPAAREGGGSTGISFVSGLLTAFCLVHGLLFAFQRQVRTHLYFALISGLGAVASWPLLLGMEDVGPALLPVLAVLVLRLFQLLFTTQQPPSRELAATALAASAARFLNEHLFGSIGVLEIVAGVVAGLVIVICAVRVLLIAWRSWQRHLDGARSITVGLAALIGFSGWSGEVPLLGGMSFAQLGVALFFGATSVHLARTYATAARRLEEQARELSDSNQRLLAANEQIEAQRRELVLAKEAADAANAAKSRFLAGVSHELRTPLNAIIGYSEMLAEEAPETGATALVPDLERIRAAARHQLVLINDILDLSKIEAGRMSLSVEEFDLEPLVRDVAVTVQPLVAKRGNELVVDCAPDAGRMRSDALKVRQMLYNLLSNAAKFTEKGRITLTVRRLPASPPVLGTAPGGSSERISLAVADTGIGLSQEQMGRLFEPFSQADPATQARYGGTGLGLALTRRFAGLLGGDVAVASEPGQGATFTLRLPATLESP